MKNSIKNCPDFHLAVISTRRPARVPKMAEVLSGMTATWYVSEGEGEEYRKAGAARVVECAPNISVARNAAISDARKEGLASIQASDDLRGVNVVSMQSGIVKSRKSSRPSRSAIQLTRPSSEDEWRSRRQRLRRPGLSHVRVVIPMGIPINCFGF